MDLFLFLLKLTLLFPWFSESFAEFFFLLNFYFFEKKKDNCITNDGALGLIPVIEADSPFVQVHIEDSNVSAGTTSKLTAKCKEKRRKHEIFLPEEQKIVDGFDPEGEASIDIGSESLSI